jgi:hypothetical protein
MAEKLKNLDSVKLPLGGGWIKVYSGLTEGLPCTVSVGEHVGVRVWFGDDDNLPPKEDNGVWLKEGDVVDCSKLEVVYMKSIEVSAIVSVVQRVEV